MLLNISAASCRLGALSSSDQLLSLSLEDKATRAYICYCFFTPIASFLMLLKRGIRWFYRPVRGIFILGYLVFALSIHFCVPAVLLGTTCNQGLSGTEGDRCLPSQYDSLTGWPVSWDTGEGSLGAEWEPRYLAPGYPGGKRHGYYSTRYWFPQDRWCLHLEILEGEEI